MSSKWGWSVLPLVLLVCQLVADPGFAQEGRRRGGGMMGRSGMVPLAGAEAVQKELGLDAAAREKVQAIVDEFVEKGREQFQTLGAGGFQNASPEERQQMMAKMVEAGQKLNAEYAPKLKETLTPEQYQRLQQISWQVAGVAALNEPELAQALELTDEQKQKIQTLSQEYLQKQRALFGGDNPQDAFAKMRELGRERDQKINEVLTPAQRTKLEELHGKPFDVSSLGQPGGRPGGPGGGGAPKSESR